MADLGGGLTKSFNSFGDIGSIGNALAGLGSMIGNKYGDDFTDSQRATQTLGNQALGLIPGVGPILQIADGLLRGASVATGTMLSNVDMNSASRLGLGSAAKTNNVLNHIPLVSGLAGGFGLWSERTNNYQLSDEASQMQSGYSGTVGDLRATEDIANKRFLGGLNWGAAKKANDKINIANKNDLFLSNLNDITTTRRQSNYYQDLLHQNVLRQSGENYLGLRVGKQGLKLMSLDEVRAIIALKHGPDKLQNGGVIGIDTNVLPEGALHAHKNNLSDINPDLEDATKKGIPVMASEGGEISEQVAEIEKEEIIFRLDVTKRLEELRKDGSEEAMIEAGKLIAEELIENTQDNVGMITEEQNG